MFIFGAKKWILIWPPSLFEGDVSKLQLTPLSSVSSESAAGSKWSGPFWAERNGSKLEKRGEERKKEEREEKTRGREERGGGKRMEDETRGEKTDESTPLDQTLATAAPRPAAQCA